MAKTKVWNKNKFEHREKFKGTEIVIPAGEFIEMDFEDAIEFKGQFSPLPPEDYAGDPAKFYKMIVVEWPKQVAQDPNAHLVNHATGQVAGSQEELKAMLALFSDRLVKDEDAEREVRTAAKSELEDLKAQVAALTAMIQGQNEKKGPGRPKKAEAVSA